MKQILLHIALCCCLMGVAQTPAEQIVAKAQTIKRLTAHFEQIKTVASLSEPTISSGKLYFSAPNKMRWQQEAPSPFLMLFVGDTMKMKVGDAPVQAFNGSSNRMLKELKNIIVGGITGELFKQQRAYDVTFRLVQNRTQAELVPRNKQMQKFMASIIMVFGADWVAEQIVLNEGNGNSTTINFTAIKTETPIADTLFELH